MGSLAMVTVSERDRQPYAKTILIQTSKVLDFKPSPSATTTKTEFYYLYSEDKQEAAHFFVADHFVNTFKSRIREAANEAWVWIHVLTTQSFTGREKTIGDNAGGEMWQINTNRIVYGYDNADGLTSYIYIERGNNKTLKLKTSHLIADISQASSASRSLSQS